MSDLIYEFVSLVSMVNPNIMPQISTIVTKEKANFATDLYLNVQIKKQNNKQRFFATLGFVKTKKLDRGRCLSKNTAVLLSRSIASYYFKQQVA